MKLTTPLGNGEVFLSSLTGQEQISELFSFELEVKTLRRRPIVFNTLLGQDIRVDIELPGESMTEVLVTGKMREMKHRRFCGIVQEITQLNQDNHFCHYRLIMKPRFWLWTQKSDCRIFQEQKVADILGMVLDGLNVDMRLNDHYHARPYCVQYNETTFDFATRLMAEEGIFYYFEHQYEGQDDEQRQRGEKLIITDSVFNLPDVTSAQQTEKSDALLTYDETSGGNRSELSIYQWHCSQKIVTTKCTLRDHSFQLTGQSLEANEEIPEQVQIGNQTLDYAPIDHELEAYKYPGQYAKHFDGISPGGGERSDELKKVFTQNGQIAKREIERYASTSIRIDGESNCPQLVPGHKFSLAKDREITGPYLVKAVRHSAYLNADLRSTYDDSLDDPKQEGHNYSNEFVCQIETQPFQPSLRQPPKIYGFQTATVVGPAGEEIFSDKFGRIKIQFHWDRTGKNDADSSCWVRVSQIWAGNRWGAFFWPRIGHEVVVTFEDGDPDRPLVVGSLYNSKNMPPLKLPDHLASSGIKSCSVGGNPLENFNCTVFHDGIGKEYLQIHSETYECMTSETSKLNYTDGVKIDFHGGGNSLLGLFGSGSGGGPSQTPPSNAADSAPSFEEKSAAELKNFLEAFKAQGSGSGGMFSTSFGDFGGTAKEAPDDAGFKNKEGLFEMISGTSDMIRMGSDFEQHYGQDMKLVCDVMSVVHSIMNPLTWLTGPPWGKGGTVDQVFGTQKGLLYGQALAVRRGAKKEIEQECLFKSNSPAADLSSYGQVVVKVTSVAILVTAVLALLLSIAMAIAIKVVMEKRQAEDWQKTVNRMQYWSSQIAKEMLELICFLEKLQAEVLELEELNDDFIRKMSVIKVTLLRILTWPSHTETAEQKAAMSAKTLTDTMKVIGVVVGLIAAVDAILKIVNAAKNSG